MMEESDSSRKEPSITPLLPNENRDNLCKRGKGEGLPYQFILECRARLLEKKTQNEALINSISALTNTRLTEFRSEMKHLDKQKWRSTNVFRR